MKVRAKNDIRVLMEDGRYSNFIKGHEYRCMLRGDGAILIDEDKMGYSTDMANFEEDFEFVSNDNRSHQHQEQPNENYFEEVNDYLDGTMSV